MTRWIHILVKHQCLPAVVQSQDERRRWKSLIWHQDPSEQVRESSQSKWVFYHTDVQIFSPEPSHKGPPREPHTRLKAQRQAVTLWTQCASAVIQTLKSLTALNYLLCSLSSLLPSSILSGKVNLDKDDQKLKRWKGRISEVADT